MTTIAYKDGVIAYDSLCTAGTTIVDHRFNKRRSVDGVQFFLAGTVADFDRACLAFFDEIDVDNINVEYLAWDGKELFLVIIENDKLHKTPESLNSIIAIGSGECHAYTAMDCGLSAKEAVKKAAYRDVGTGGRIRTYKL